MPDEGLLCDVLWSDPEPDQKGWGENDRGVSFTFGTDVVTKFLNRHDLDLVRGDERLRSTPPHASNPLLCAFCLQVLVNFRTVEALRAAFVHYNVHRACLPIFCCGAGVPRSPGCRGWL